MGHPSYFQRLPRLRSVTARQSSSERQPNFAALNRRRHLCSAGRLSRWALAHISSLWLPYVIGQTIIFSSCFFYFFFLSSFFISAPNLSGRRLDVYHTSAHGVALVRISNSGLKCAACGSLQIQDAKKSPSRHHRTKLSGHIFATKACIHNRKKLAKQQYLLYRPTNG